MEITNYTDEKLTMIMNQYAARRAREKINYEKKKDDEIFKVSNRARSAKHYEKNKEQRQQYYVDNKAECKMRNSYNYFRRKDDLEGFKVKHPIWAAKLLLDIDPTPSEPQ
tara:strand:+ start:1033 stop:1362 length:330 start_codon:yes stop_codon:yes gene_type:complete